MVMLMPAVSFATNPPFKSESLSYSIFDQNVMGYCSGSVLDGMESRDGMRSNTTISRKSPLLAGFMSAAIPGAGEVYAGRWWRGIMHFGVELAAWGFYFHYDSRGDSQTRLFERYANQHWSVVKYAQWLNDYLGANININGDTSLPPWERVNWTELNDFEKTVPHFSHRLDPYGTQQYYEMIGKYPQFNRGWEDSTPHPDPSVEVSVNNGPGLYYHDISEMFLFYSGKRGYANTLYARAHNAAIVVFLNHFISAFHAAYLAHRFNETHFTVDIENRNDIYGERFVPTVRLRVGF